MRAYLPFVVIGLTTGAIYALASLGLLLTYRTSGVFNFAHGALGMFTAYLFYSLRQHLPTAAAVLIAVVVLAPLMGVALDRLLFRRIHGRGSTAPIVVSLGLLVALQGLATAIYGGQTRRVEPIFPTGTYRLFDVNVGIDQTLVVAIAVTLGLALIVFFRMTPLGLQTRAVVSNADLTKLTGVNASAVTTGSWMIGASFAGVSGILIAPFIGLDSLLLTLLVVEAFGAAVVGRLASFPLTAAAAFGLGIAQNLAVKVIADVGWPSLAGLPSALPFVALFAVLVFSRKGSFGTIGQAILSTGRRSRVRRPALPKRSLLAFFAVCAVLPPFLSGARLVTLTATVAYVLLFLSLSLVVGLSRQMSLVHAFFVSFGATTVAHLMSAGVPFPAALIGSALALVPLGAIMAIPAIRLSGLHLALATFGFGILAQNLLFPTALAFGADGIVKIPRPSLLSGQLGFFYFVLAVVLVGVIAIETARATRLGRILTALADAPTAVESLGISGLASRVLVFCLSAFFAAVAGGLLGSLVQVVNPLSFDAFSSLVWVAVLVAAGASTFGGSVLAAILFIAVPATLSSSLLTDWQPVLYGVAAVLLAQTDNGLVGLVRLIDFKRWSEGTRWRLDSERSAERLRRTVEVRGLRPSKAER